ncbi:diguanylate cyclase [Hyphomonas sp.]|uniref:GGDEF domain-containing protein n=1 Tax=Hyphomonas sp. TaxID=87 RepID=UPI00391879AC
MFSFPPPRFEQQKSEVLQRYRIFRGACLHDAGHIARAAALALEVPVALAALNERYRAWYRSAHGVTERRFAALQEFCGLANLADTSFAVSDVRREPYFAGHEAVTGPEGVVFFAGAPLADPDGKRFGSLCLIGPEPRATGPEEIALLESFAQILSQDICLRSAGRYAVADLIEAEQEKCALYDLAATDPLTRALNRRAFFRFSERELMRSARHGRTASVIVFDIDHFKRVNDVHGHDLGDRVLKRLTELVAASIRDEDLLGRLGGEEFAILLPETPPERAMALAARLLEAVRELHFDSAEGSFGVSISAGISMGEPGEQDVSAALNRADKALYRAKRGGRDRAEMELANRFVAAEAANVVQLAPGLRQSGAA